jgi:adenylate cyclase
MADQPQTLAVLFADICDSTRLYHELGDAVAHRLAAQCLKLIAEATTRCGGTVVKTIGDGAMSTFLTADEAYRAATRIQEGLRGSRLKIKIGFHIGPVIVADNDVFGDTVNLAARMLARSGPGEILMTRACVDVLQPHHRTAVRLLDTTMVKGRPEEVEIHGVIGDLENMTITADQLAALTGDTGRATAVVLTYRSNNIRLEPTGAPALIGRDAGCRLVIRSECASRRHATIDVQRNRFVLTDHSTNGTFIVDQSGNRQFLKREAVHLAGKGVISVGIAPDRNPDDLIHYRYE